MQGLLLVCGKRSEKRALGCERTVEREAIDSESGCVLYTSDKGCQRPNCVKGKMPCEVGR